MAAAAVQQQGGLAGRDHRRAKIDALHRAADPPNSPSRPMMKASYRSSTSLPPRCRSRRHASLALDHQRRGQALAVGSVEVLRRGRSPGRAPRVRQRGAGVELVETQGERAHFVRIVARQQPRAEIGLAHRPPALTRSQQKPGDGAGRLFSRATSAKAASPAAPLRHHQQAPDQRAIDAGQPRHRTPCPAPRGRATAQVGSGRDVP